MNVRSRGLGAIIMIASAAVSVSDTIADLATASHHGTEPPSQAHEDGAPPPVRPQTAPPGPGSGPAPPGSTSPVTMTVRTVPALPGIAFLFDGNPLVTNSAGTARR